MVGRIRSLDLGSGKSDTLLPGTSIIDFDISQDEKLVAFSTPDGPEGEPPSGSLHSTAVRRLVRLLETAMPCRSVRTTS